MGETASGHVAARHVHGYDPLPEADARGGNRVEVPDAGPLKQGEFPHLLVGEADIVLDALRDAFNETPLLFLAKDEVAFPPVEAAGDFPHGLFPPRPNIRKHGLDHLAGLAAVLFRTFCGFLQIFHMILNQC